MKKVMSFAVMVLLGLAKVSQAQSAPSQVPLGLASSIAVEQVKTNAKKVTMASQLPKKQFAEETDSVMTVSEGIQTEPQVTVSGYTSTGALGATKKSKKSKKVHHKARSYSDLESCEEDNDCEKGERCVDVTDGDESDTSGKCLKKKDADAFKAFKKHHPHTLNNNRLGADGQFCDDNNADCSADEHCVEKACVKLQPGAFLQSKLPDCTTKRDVCEYDSACERGEVCIMDSEDEGYCFPAACADDDFDLKVKTAKKAKEPVTILDCMTKRDRCELDKQCEVGEKCLDDSENEGYCLPEGCSEYDFDLMKVRRTPHQPKKAHHHEHKTEKIAVKRYKCDELGGCDSPYLCNGVWCVDEDTFYAELKTKKSPHAKKYEIDCTGRAVCEDHGDCELGEVCGADSADELQCYPEACIAPMNPMSKIKVVPEKKKHHNKVKRRGEDIPPAEGVIQVERIDVNICLDSSDCRQNEDCSCRYWPQCKCVERTKAVVTSKSSPVPQHKAAKKVDSFYNDDSYIQ